MFYFVKFIKLKTYLGAIAQLVEHLRMQGVSSSSPLGSISFNNCVNYNDDFKLLWF